MGREGVGVKERERKWSDEGTSDTMLSSLNNTVFISTSQRRFADIQSDFVIIFNSETTQ